MYIHCIQHCYYLPPAHEDNFQLQMAKLGCGLMSGEYSFDTELRNVIDEGSNQVSD